MLLCYGECYGGVGGAVRVWGYYGGCYGGVRSGRGEEKISDH